MPKKDDPGRERLREDWDGPDLERLGIQGILLALALASLPDRQQDASVSAAEAELTARDHTPAEPAGVDEVQPGLEPAFGLPPLRLAPEQPRRTAWRHHWVTG